MVTRTKKIFVGGLSAPTTLDDVKNYFEQFGPVSFRAHSSIVPAVQRYTYIVYIYNSNLHEFFNSTWL